MRFSCSRSKYREPLRNLRFQKRPTAERSEGREDKAAQQPERHEQAGGRARVLRAARTEPSAGAAERPIQVLALVREASNPRRVGGV